MTYILFPFLFQLSPEWLPVPKGADDEWRENKSVQFWTQQEMMTKKNKTMCGSVASYNIHSEQRPDNKQTTPRKKKSEQKNPQKNGQTEDAANILLHLSHDDKWKKKRQEDADM